MNNKLLCWWGIKVPHNTAWKRGLIWLDEHLWKIYEAREYSRAYFYIRRIEFNTYDFQADDTDRHE